MNTIHPYTAPSDIGRDWRAGSTGEQHTMSCRCSTCTSRRLYDIFITAAFRAREAGCGAIILSAEYDLPTWLVRGDAGNETVS